MIDVNFYKVAKLHDTAPLKAHLHRRILLQQLNAIFVAAKSHQVSNMLKTPAISRQQIALRIAPGLHVRFWDCNFGLFQVVSYPYFF